MMQLVEGSKNSNINMRDVIYDNESKAVFLAQWDLNLWCAYDDEWHFVNTRTLLTHLQLLFRTKLLLCMTGKTIKIVSAHELKKNEETKHSVSLLPARRRVWSLRSWEDPSRIGSCSWRRRCAWPTLRHRGSPWLAMCPRSEKGLKLITKIILSNMFNVN